MTEPEDAEERMPPEVPPDDPEPSPDERTEEEQMADYEEALKNEDWGHQPC